MELSSTRTEADHKFEDERRVDSSITALQNGGCSGLFTNRKIGACMLLGFSSTAHVMRPSSNSGGSNSRRSREFCALPGARGPGKRAPETAIMDSSSCRKKKPGRL
ncbi:hypothetical protein M409DRAFT_54886 [Zasmidium cellare ATCC 36951]|uniref:Uncharacterized protein n=1 Tax=Zasmidium cellare ATCC 36951 TaxID=1080233 RepID=A0A6A6CLE8_ZASCE|nr:uncharacterized protein M409DRAFT_54886 [Zasmidium cellare ATCC 36951]KAF2166549.1 hypothetical protein M409DRAFT_54886 [Zasmidium cellare ATCC 36951]